MDLQKDVVMAEEPAEAAEELLEDDDVEADLGVDTEDLLDGASGGVPTNEKMRIAQECVVGRPRGLGTVAARTAYLGKLARADKKMLLSRCSAGTTYSSGVSPNFAAIRILAPLRSSGGK
eukprot:TRINITY_DN17044_c0_g1_i1.p1 TRINITY_DN17044_c0_g1~~TRINITY_DN17044_c0_g1_i1.p1  ORF type:complete len:120 (-),score=25.99 TRINITY_DN17044_c0_g1_i1:792-1151(-)